MAGITVGEFGLHIKCSICHDGFMDEDEKAAYVIPDCGHVFHMVMPYHGLHRILTTGVSGNV